MNQHFLQSSAWEQFQQSLGRNTFRRSGDGWEYLAILEHGMGNTRLYCPYGPSADNEDAFRQALDSLIKLGAEQQVTFLRVNPINPEFIPILEKHRWREMTYQSLQPKHTHIIDLTQSTETILHSIGSTNRNLFRNYHKKDLKIHHSTDPNDVSIFLSLIHKVAVRTGMTPHTDAYFQQQADIYFPAGNASLFYVTHNNTPITATIVYDNATTRYYAHTGTDSNYAKQRGGNILVTHMILDAKEKGLQFFDFWGVAPPDAPASHPWSGFSKFKRSFGGHDVTFGGTWELPLRPMQYHFYRLYQSLRRKLR